MEKFLRPERLEAHPDSSPLQWKHWFSTFTNFLLSIEQPTDTTKLQLLINYVSPSVYSYIADCKTYDEAIKTLKAVFVKPTSEVFARHQLATRKQQGSESVDQYVLAVKLMAKDCVFKAVTAEQYAEEAVRDSFISGLSSSVIRQRLLEKLSLTLEEAVQQARSLELAQLNADMYVSPSTSGCHSTAVAVIDPRVSKDSEEVSASAKATAATKNCFYCGSSFHPRYFCPARNATCHKCGKKGHFASVCQAAGAGRNWPGASAAKVSSMTTASTSPLHCATIPADINEVRVEALVDSGSTSSFINPIVASRLSLTTTSSKDTISMASSPLAAVTVGHCFVNIKVMEKEYKSFKLSLLPDLCADVVLGQDFMKLHQSVEFTLQGSRPKLTICGISKMNLRAPSLFPNLTNDCRPIATPTRRHSSTDSTFIRKEIDALLREGIIEESQSPWRAQVLVTSDERHKKRMVVDYSRTINRYTLLDAYPIPRIDELVHKLAKYRIFSKLDMKSAYHQVPLKEDEKLYTAFEANGQLFQFTRIPFGLTNAVSAYQRTINTLISENGLSDTFAYIDDLIIGGMSQEDHDENLRRFEAVAEKYKLTLNKDKCEYRLPEIKYLGYLISNGTLRPDPERLQPLRDLPLPTDSSSLKRTLGLLSYYSQWIPNYSNRISPLLTVKTFPLDSVACQCLHDIKEDVCRASVAALDENVPMEIESDASATSLAATLSQQGRPVAFFSRRLSPSEQRQPTVEREAAAIIESIRKWRLFLIGREFKIITDQQAVSYMFHSHHSSKIKNDKILRWRLELAGYKYDIQYRPGKDNLPADALSRSCSATVESLTDLEKVHDNLCHPGVTRLYHFVKSKNLPYSLEDVKKVNLMCRSCCELKPRFFKPPTAHLIHALCPFDRISVDFIGPKPSSSRNKYLLVMIDEYSRFPFAYPCSDMSAHTVINCFLELFSVFGCPSSIHSDRGSQFMSREVSEFLSKHGVVMTHSTPYHPQGNGQCEKENGVIWKAIRLALHSRNLPERQWEMVLNNALHSIRSLLCTATNQTPHERLFSFPRKSSNGYSLPSWLSQPGPVFVRKFVRTSKSDSLVEPASLINATPHYARVQYGDGREATVSTKDLAPSYEERLPTPADDHHQSNYQAPPYGTRTSPVTSSGQRDERSEPEVHHVQQAAQDRSLTTPLPPSNPGGSKIDGHPSSLPSGTSPKQEPLRRSTRIKKPVDRLGY